MNNLRRVLWLTDIHLEFLTTAQIDHFLAELRAYKPHVLLIGGDIGSAGHLHSYLSKIVVAVGAPVYFVLGNHDYYGASVAEVRAAIPALTRQIPELCWLDAANVQQLAPGVGLVGHGGWADGRYGNFLKSSIILSDYVRIAELTDVTPVQRFQRVCAFADEGARHLRRVLSTAVQHYPHIYVLTHAPPFVEACWHEGETPALDDPYLPHFTCKAIGDVLLEFAERHSTTLFTVLCGHTHGGGEANPLPNLHVITGPAEYGTPAVQQIFTFV